MFGFSVSFDSVKPCSDIGLFKCWAVGSTKSCNLYSDNTTLTFLTKCIETVCTSANSCAGCGQSLCASCAQASLSCDLGAISSIHSGTSLVGCFEEAFCAVGSCLAVVASISSIVSRWVGKRAAEVIFCTDWSLWVHEANSC